ncbi:MAG: glutathione S-transferase N-terminal domain-containing protein [Marinospirillum sp.]|uniref:glutathione S-transferase N-terminal domain-containing protein n=1 Tax=Marinospirillum sp. TaxID=2183934 RepID=UPI0019E4D261|nr:glutathione S-transferase N-terminal domain-containing protein [Marinospirillum sp.]MBE0505127.1 glutathione S-transferase N-terminal domain-containing protein [Marinospirillum sp.]
MKLYLNATSPYARFVRVVALEKGLKPELVWVDPWSNDPALLAVNPALRVPALETDAGLCLSESMLIALHLEQEGATPQLLPKEMQDQVLQLMGWGQGLTDAAFNTVIARKHQGSAVDQSELGKRRLAAITHTLQQLEHQAARLEQLNLGSLLVAVALDYLSFRLPEIQWQKHYPMLADWQQTLLQRDSFKSTAFA